MKNIKRWLLWILERLKSEKTIDYLTPIFALSTLPLVIYLAINLPSGELKDILQWSAQLNVTVAIGIGTLEIAIKASGRAKTGLIKEILSMISISVFSFFISYIQHDLIQRIYFGLSGLLIMLILLSAFYYVMKMDRTT